MTWRARQEAQWSYATSMSGRCEWAWCRRRFTRQCRNVFPAPGGGWFSDPVWLCEKHSEKQIERNLQRIVGAGS